jgi:hypothetical protein
MIDAMKSALEALEELMPTGPATAELRTNAIAALRQAIEQAEKESTLQEMSDIGQEIEHAEKPVAWKCCPPGKCAYRQIHKSANCPHESLLADNTPLKREWVGLTHGELAECQSDNPYQVYRAIEAKLRERNT